jgi:hypothetical protein
MPSGPPELHAKWETDGNAIRYLESHGYTLLRNWHWRLPEPCHIETTEEKSALDYLWLEWDFGGVVE